MTNSKLMIERTTKVSRMRRTLVERLLVLVPGVAVAAMACESSPHFKTLSSPEEKTLAVARSAIAPVLGTTQSLAVLAGTTVTNTGPTVVTGILGVSPGSAVTGFPPGLVNGGTIQAGNAVALQAQSDATTAYDALAGQACSQDLSGQDLGGLTLTAGTYCFSSSAQLTGTLTLNAEGDPAAVFIFQIGSKLTTASNSSVRVINGGNFCNVYWQVGSSATIGTGTTFMGSIIALTSITLTTGASLFGRALARNAAVTMDTNTVSAASCQVAPDAGTPDAAASEQAPAATAATAATRASAARRARGAPTSAARLAAAAPKRQARRAQAAPKRQARRAQAAPKRQARLAAAAAPKRQARRAQAALRASAESQARAASAASKTQAPRMRGTRSAEIYASTWRRIPSTAARAATFAVLRTRASAGCAASPRWARRSALLGALRELASRGAFTRVPGSSGRVRLDVFGGVDVMTKRDDLAAFVERPEVEFFVPQDLPRGLHLELDDNLSTDLVAAREDAEDLEVAHLDRPERRKEVSRALLPLAGLEVRNALHLGVVLLPVLPLHVLADVLEDCRDIALAESFVDVSDDGLVVHPRTFTNGQAGVKRSGRGPRGGRASGSGADAED